MTLPHDPGAVSFLPHDLTIRATTPVFAQRIAGMTTRGFKMRTNPSGRRVPAGYNEPEEFNWPGDSAEMPGIKYSIDAPSQEIPNEEINAFYRAGTPEANAAVERELMKPARDAVNWLKKQGLDQRSGKDRRLCAGRGHRDVEPHGLR